VSADLVPYTIVVNKDYKAQFPKLFSGLGKLDGLDCVMKLKRDAKPFILSTPRRAPVPLLSKAKEELSRIEQVHMISKVNEPREWCAGMAVVPKANNSLNLCGSNKAKGKHLEGIPPLILC